MSLNQSRADKSEAQLRKPGRSGSSNHQRSYAGAAGKGGGGTAPPPSPLIPSPPSLSTNRSLKKSSNGQGGQSRVGFANTNSEQNAAAASNRPMQNGSHVQSHGHGVSDASVPVAAKAIDSSLSRSSRSLPKATSSQTTSGAPESAVPVTPTKGDVSKSFPLQFGSISPGLMNGMQIPARTSSAPPNLDEQKRDQALHNSARAAPTMPIPPHNKQQQVRKDVGSMNQSNAHPPAQAKRDIHIPIPAATAATTQKSPVLPMTGISMSMPFQQSQVAIQFGGPSPHIQSQGATIPSLQMPISLPVANAAQVEQQVFVPSFQSHPMQPQGMIPQGQSLGFAPQMGHLVPKLGNLRIGTPPQYAQQQAGKFGALRIPVKITHPETHEELKLDKRIDSHLDVTSSGPRAHPNVPPQAQPIHSFSPAQPVNYYPPIQPSSYNSHSFFFQSPTSLPLTGSQINPGSSASRYNYPVGQGGQSISFMNPSALNPLPVCKAGPPMQSMPELMTLERTHDGHIMSVATPSTSVQVTVKPAVGSPAAKTWNSSVAANPSAGKGESSKLLRQPGEASAHHQQREIDMGLESSLQQPKSASESLEAISLTAAVKSSTASSPDASLLALPDGTSSAPVDPADDSTSVVTNKESRKKEFQRRSDSFKDQQKKVCKNELQHFQQQHQADFSDCAGLVGTTSLKLSKDDFSSDLNVQQVSKNSEILPVLSEAVKSPSAAPSKASPILEHRPSSVGASESEEHKPLPSMPGTSGVVLDTETKLSEDVHSSSCSSSEALTGGVRAGEGGPCEPVNLSDLEEDVATSENLDAACHTNQVTAMLEKQKISGAEHRKTEMTDGSAEGGSNVGAHAGSAISESTEGTSQIVASRAITKIYDVQEMNADVEHCCAESEQMNTDAEVSCSSEADKTTDNLNSLVPMTSLGHIDAETTTSKHISSTDAQEDESLSAYVCSVENETRTSNQEVSENESAASCQEPLPALSSVSSENNQKLDGRSMHSVGNGPVSTSLAPTDRISSEQNRTKTTAGKRKKRREYLLKADAAGTSSDLFMAYKGPEPETAGTPETVDSSPDVKEGSKDAIEKEVLATEDDAQCKVELDDWEDAAGISSPKLKTLENREQVDGARMHDDDYGSGVMGKRKYTKDFLLTLKEQCTDLPIGFEIGSDIVDAVMGGPVATTHLVERESHPSSGRIIDRPIGGSRVDDRWNKAAGPFSYGREPRLDVGHGGAVINFRPGQGGNHGVLRNPRVQSSGQYVDGILSGPMQALTSLGGLSRNSPDADRWQRPIQKGLIPSPQTHLQVMHKTEKKYEVGKVSDKEEAKQRQLKAILNKLTPQNFEKLFQQVKEVNIDNAVTLTGVISQIFDKALMEPTFCEMYANFCLHLADELPDFREDNEKITFKRLLLNKCQEEFERGEREQAEANRAEEEGEIKQSEQEREEKRIKARRRMLGNIRLIGELYKKKMLTERIMHECIQKLLGQHQNPDEEDVESLCKLMSTIGEMIDHPKAKEYMDVYFDSMQMLSSNQNLSSRVRFMLRDAIDLRKNKWQQRRKIEGPKKIEEVHRDAAQERHLQASRSSRGPGVTSSARRGQPFEYGSRTSTGPASPGSQQVSLRSLQPPLRGGFMSPQDARLEDRHPFESRTLLVPLPQRSNDDNSITLGPQGGLARGMSIRGQLPLSSVPLADSSPTTGDPRRIASGPNGYSSASELTSYNAREEFVRRYLPDRFAAAPSYEQSNSQDHNLSFGNRDLRNTERPFDGSISNSPATGHMQGPSTTAHTVPSEPSMSEDHLRDMSIAAIREFYGARNEEEVLLCIKDLKSPGFYPEMVMLWVTDSFDRKNDVDRDLLAKLLVNLCKSRDSLLSHGQLAKGFESVLSTLEDAVTDSPKAAEYLGRILGKIVAEKVIPLKEIGRLIREGGEEPGCLLQSGLGADVLVSTLEIIRREKGETTLKEIRVSSNLRLEDFRPPDPIKSKLDAFI